jgi:hypothetical protein
MELYHSEEWKKWDDRSLVGLALFQKRLFCPFDVFHAAIERVLDRPVRTHEFGLNLDGLISEYLGDTPKPSFEDIMNLIPAEKRITILCP